MPNNLFREELAKASGAGVKLATKYVKQHIMVLIDPRLLAF